MKDKDLIQMTLTGISECCETEVDLIIMGRCIYATYESENDRIEEFGYFDINSLKPDLDVYINSDPSDSKLYEVLSKYCRRLEIEPINYLLQANSKSWKHRALVAMNGECLEMLSKDTHEGVRQKVAESLVYEHERGDGFTGVIDFACSTEEEESTMFKYFVPLSINLGNINYIDAMLTDSSMAVRYNIARLGITRHLDILVNDEDRYVRMAVARNGLTGHLEQLLNDPCKEVVRLVVSNQNATAEQLQTIAHTTKKLSVLVALVKRGVFHNFFIEYTEDDVRDVQWLKYVAAQHGHCHEILSQDESFLVREGVAHRTSNLDILNRLIEDEDPDVKYAAKTRIEMLASIKQEQ